MIIIINRIKTKFKKNKTKQAINIKNNDDTNENGKWEKGNEEGNEKQEMK